MFLVWGFEMDFRRRLNVRPFLVASEDGTLRAVSASVRDVAHAPRLGAYYHCRQRLLVILVQGPDGRCASYAGRAERRLGVAGQCLE